MAEVFGAEEERGAGARGRGVTSSMARSCRNWIREPACEAAKILRSCSIGVERALASCATDLGGWQFPRYALRQETRKVHCRKLPFTGLFRYINFA